MRVLDIGLALALDWDKLEFLSLGYFVVDLRPDLRSLPFVPFPTIWLISRCVTFLLPLDSCNTNALHQTLRAE